MLKDIQSYIANRGTVSLTDLSMHFRTDGSAIQPMLDRLSRKGRIRKMSQEQCMGCTSCDRHTLELYEWVSRA